MTQSCTYFVLTPLEYLKWSNVMCNLLLPQDPGWSGNGRCQYSRKIIDSPEFEAYVDEYLHKYFPKKLFPNPDILQQMGTISQIFVTPTAVLDPRKYLIFHNKVGENLCKC